jgi:hypothetical protein
VLGEEVDCGFHKGGDEVLDVCFSADWWEADWCVGIFAETIIMDQKVWIVGCIVALLELAGIVGGEAGVDDNWVWYIREISILKLLNMFLDPFDAWCIRW